MSFYRKYGKRVFDLCLTVPAFVVLSPVMLVTAGLVAVKLGRPVLFTQERPGYKEKIFRMYKFRTMTDARNANGELLSDEERLTPFGEKLRSTSLDELPELLNILKGDMSIVGNRPLPLYEAELLTSDEHIDRFMGPAGLTGLWQVEKRGEAGKLSAEERKQLDITYAKTFSFWLDIKIILKTVTAFIQKENV